MQPGQDCFGVPKKIGKSEIRISGVSLVTCANPIFYVVPGNQSAILSGSCDDSSIMTNDSTNGLRIVIKREGLYAVSLSLRITTGAATFAVVRFRPSLGTSIGSYEGTADEILFFDATSTNNKFGQTSTVYLYNGDILIPITGTNNGMSSFQLVVNRVR